MDTNNICVHCGGTEGHFVEERGQVQHFYKDTCIEHLRAQLAAADAKIAQLEGQLARTAFVTNRRPADETDVEVLLVAQWEPRIVPEAPGRWRDRRFETLNGVQGWRLRAEAGEATE